MSFFWRTMFPPGAPVPSAALVFLSMLAVAIVQTPLSLLVRDGWSVVAIALNEILAVAGVPLLLVWRFRFDVRQVLPIGRPTVKAAIAVVVLMAGADILIDYGTVVTEWFIAPNERVGALYRTLLVAASASEVAVKLVVLCALPALCEEIYFRGFCQGSLACHWGPRRALVAAAALFALLHGHPAYLHLYFGLGLLLGWIFAATRGLWAAMLAHFLNNLWTFLGYLTGRRLPLSEPLGAPDAFVAAMGVAIFAAGIWMVRRTAADTSPHP